jgi:DNA-binding beta-propeller fold protein YncE
MPRIILASAALILTAVSLAAGDFAARQDVGGFQVEVGIKTIAAGAPLQEEEPVLVDLRIVDGSGKPVAGMQPAAWLSLRNSADHRPSADRCKENIATFTAGNVFVRPEVDLNVYHVLALNDDATITVIDPHFDFGGSRLLSLVSLRARGEDWTLNDDASHLFVSMPKVGAVSVIDTNRWKQERELAVGENPRRVLRQPNGHAIWVVTSGGVVALKPDGSGIAGRINTSDAPRELVLSDDSRTAMIAGATTATFVDIATMKVTGKTALPSATAGADFSPLSRLFYVASEGGQVTAIDPRTAAVKAHFDADGAPVQLRFAPGGRLGFIVVPSRNEVQIFDASSNKIVQTADVDHNPDRVSFTDQLAYIRSLGSDMVLMAPLDKLGTAGAPVPLVDFPAGEKKFADGPAPSIADGIVPTPGDLAVLVAHPGDREIYYYQEGMAAPMGHFSNDGRAPRAVLVLDRTLRPGSGGHFTTTARLGRPGKYDVSVFVDSPRVISCFEMPVSESPTLAAKRQRHSAVEYTSRDLTTRPGQKVRIAFRIIDPTTRQQKGGLQDVTALLFAPGLVNARRTAVPLADGTYEVEVTPPATGIYSLCIDSPTAGLPPNNPDILTLRAQG